MISSFKKRSVFLIVTFLVISMSLLSGMLLSKTHPPGTRGLKAWHTRQGSDDNIQDIHSRCILPVCSRAEPVVVDKPFHNTPLLQASTPVQASAPAQFDGKPVHEGLFPAPQATWLYYPCRHSPKQQLVLLGAGQQDIHPEQRGSLFHLARQALTASAIRAYITVFTYLAHLNQGRSF